MRGARAKIATAALLALAGVLLATIASSSADTIDPYTTSTIEPYTGHTIEPYRAPTIKPVRSHYRLKRFLSHGVRRRVSCGGPCTVLQRMWLDEINWNIIRAFSGSRVVVIGRSSKKLRRGGHTRIATK